MTDFEKTKELLNKNNIDYSETFLFGSKDEKPGFAIWLDTGHFEYDAEGKIFNIVCY